MLLRFANTFQYSTTFYSYDILIQPSLKSLFSDLKEATRKKMSSSSVSAAAIIIVVTVTVSLSPIVSSGNQLNEPQHNDYDRSCFVPPSQHDDSKPVNITSIL